MKPGPLTSEGACPGSSSKIDCERNCSWHCSDIFGRGCFLTRRLAARALIPLPGVWGSHAAKPTSDSPWES